MEGIDPGACPITVERAAMVQWWDELTFLHWRYPAEQVQALLPDGLEVETGDGSAWVSLVPFHLSVALPHTPQVPWLCRFPETNVRTYVRSPADGRSGVWFFSLDADRLAAVLVARLGYRLPYVWSRMRLDRAGDRVRYDSRRRWPGPRGASCHAVVEPGEAYEPASLTELDHFLTARWGLFSTPRSGLHHAEVWHEPWPLHRVEVLELQDELVAASGLPAPTGPPLAHWSPGVQVRIAWPQAVPTSSR